MMNINVNYPAGTGCATQIGSHQACARRFCLTSFAARSFAAAKFAFTLIELLLAVAIFAIVLLAVHGVFYGAIGLRNKTVDALDFAVPLNHALAIITRDVANIVPPGGVLAGQLQTTPTATDSTALSTATAAPGTAGRQVGPEFYTATGIITDTASWGDIQRVAYYLIAPTNNAPGNDLVRVVWRNLLPVLTEQPESQWLMSGIEDITFLFFDGTQWTSMWDSTTQEPALPMAIKVQIELARSQIAPLPRSKRWLTEVIVPITVQVRTNQLAQTPGGAS